MRLLMILAILVASATSVLATKNKQQLDPDAAALKEAQKYWPNVPLCDDGGYRIRPCYLGGGKGR